MAEGTEIASLFVKISADLSKLQSGLNQTESAIGSTAKNLAKIGLGAGLAVGGAVVAGIVSSIGEASASQKAATQLNAVLKSTGGAAGVTADQAQALANSLQDVTTFSDETTLSGESMLLTFTNIGKDVFPQATRTMLDMSQALGQDVKSSAIQLGKALNDPIQGITALQRVGVSFTESQKKEIKALVLTGNTLQAQKLILAELNKEFGGSAIAAGTTLPGKLEILKNKFSDVQEKIGGAFIPFLTKLAEKLIETLGNPVVQTALDNFASFFEKIAGGDIQGALKQLGVPQDVITQLQALGEGLGKVASAVGDLISDFQQGGIDAVIAGLGEKLNLPDTTINGMQNLADAFGKIKTAISDWQTAGFDALIADLGLFGANDQTINNVQDLADGLAGIEKATTPLMEAIKHGDLQQIGTALAGIAGPDITKGVQGLAEGFGRIDYALSPKGIGAGVDAFKKNLNDLGTFLNGQFKPRFEWFATTAGKIKDAFQPLADYIKQTVDKIVALDSQAAKEISGPIFQFVQTVLVPFADKAWSIANAIGTILKNLGDLANAIAGGDIGGIGNALGNMFGGHNALGGNVRRGRASIVGEQGPELFMPGVSGRIIPLGAGGGGGSLTVVYSPMFSMADEEEFERQIMPMMRENWRKLQAGQ